MFSSENLILVRKSYGATPLEVIQGLRRLGLLEANEKATYAGRLDPLATGLMLILKGEGVHLKEEFLGLDKVYEIEIVFGVKTDTGDVLGLAEEVAGAGPCEVPDVAEIVRALGEVESAPFPAFSSRTVGGVPLHVHARAGESVERPERAMSFNILKGEKMEDVSEAEIHALALRACELVRGDFRQTAIAESWSNALLPSALPRVSLKIEATSGTYMRAIPDILKQAFGMPCVVTHIHRVKVGDFDIKQALHIAP